MKYEIEIYKNDKMVENYIATEYKTVTPRGRLGTTIPKENRKTVEINILPEGKKRRKNYSTIFGDKVIIKELETGRRILTFE